MFGWYSAILFYYFENKSFFLVTVVYGRFIFNYLFVLGDFCNVEKNFLRSGTTHGFGMSYAFSDLEVSDWNRQIKSFIRKLMSFNN